MNKNNQISKLQLCLLVLFVSGFFWLCQYYLPVFRLAENWLQDLRTAWLTPPVPVSGDIIIVTINDETLEQMAYRSPVDRAFLADLLRSLDARNPRLVALDMLLDQNTETEKDRQLKQVIEQLRSPLVVARADESVGMTEKQLAFQADYLKSIDNGLAYVLEDEIDGIVRAIYLGLDSQTIEVPGFVVRIAQLLNLQVPQQSQMALRYQAGENRQAVFPVYPSHRIDLLPADWFENRIVFIGSDMPTDDRHRTPMSVLSRHPHGDVSGVWLHAYALQQLINGQRLIRLSGTSSFILLLGLCTIVSWFAGSGMNLARKNSLLLLLVVVLTTLAGFLYYHVDMVLPLFAPITAMIALMFLITALQWRAERHQRHFIEQAFGRYVDDNVVRQLCEYPDQLALGGERRTMTFVFTDIQNFVALSESLPESRLMPLIQEYMDHMTRLVIEHGGLIDKMNGDGMNIIFNAPLHLEKHAAAAVDCALAMDRFCRKFSAAHQDRDIPLGLTRIGINSGKALLGNFGSDIRFDYTAVGRAVNLAARLEPANKLFGTTMCMSQWTAELLSGFIYRAIGSIKVVGSDQWMDIHEPLGSDSSVRLYLAEYQEAWRKLESDPEGAQDRFNGLAKQYPADPLVRFHCERLQRGESGNRILMTSK